MAAGWALELVSNAERADILTMCSERAVLTPLSLFAGTCQGEPLITCAGSITYTDGGVF